jgi:hypothetical protein
MLDLIRSRILPARQSMCFEHTRRGTDGFTPVSLFTTETFDDIWESISPDESADY